MKRLILFSILFLSIFSQLAIAQNKVKVFPDSNLDTMIARNAEENKNHMNKEGYRIQLFSGSDRNNLNAIRTKFKLEYPDEQVYIIYQQPQFKLRVGDYRNLIEAQEKYTLYQKNYGQILIVPDKINLPKL